MKTKKRKTGDLGEDLACTFLMKRGYEIVERNYLKKYGEIDIVAKKADLYEFFEVKTVTHVTESGEMADIRPEENMTAYKFKKLSRVIEAYILDKKLNEYEWKISLITVKLNMATRLAHFDVFEGVIL